MTFFESAILNFLLKKKSASSQWKSTLFFVWGIVYFCTMDGFFRILEKTSSKIICTRLYVLVFTLPWCCSFSFIEWDMHDWLHFLDSAAVLWCGYTTYTKEYIYSLTEFWHQESLGIFEAARMCEENFCHIVYTKLSQSWR